MAEVIFFVAAFGAIAGAIGTIAMRNPFYSVLSLVAHLLSLATLFLLLRAEFVAAAQVIVYAGAVMVLYVFVVAYVGGAAEPLTPARGRRLNRLSTVFAAMLLVEFLIAILGSSLKFLDSEGSGYFAGFGSPEQIGTLLLTEFLLAFEIVSFLALMAAVGAVVLARRRTGLDQPTNGQLSVSELLRGQTPDRPRDRGIQKDSGKQDLGERDLSKQSSKQGFSERDLNQRDFSKQSNGQDLKQGSTNVNAGTETQRSTAKGSR